jgi:hypothetical protein
MQRADTNQHYVSRFLLRGFHGASEAQIWAFDKLSGKSFSTSIDAVASENGFYNIAGSPALDEVIGKIENATAPIVAEIRARKALTGLDDDKRIWLSGFTALQLVRTKAYSERTQAMMRQLTQIVTHASGGKLSKKVRKQLGLDASASGHEKTLSTILGLTRVALAELLGKTLVLYRSEPSSPFWIGDSPVALQNTINPGDGIRGTLGLGVPGIEVYLPISSELVLAHMCPSIAVAYTGVQDEARRMGFIHAHAEPYLQALKNGSAILLSKEYVTFQRALQVGCAERFVYSPVNDFDEAREMLEENSKLKTGPRYGGPTFFPS